MKREFVLIAAMTMLIFAIGESRGDLLQNMNFDSGLDGWTIGATSPSGDWNPLGTWDVQWTEDHGGSAKMYIAGFPGKTTISQLTQIAIEPGDKITVNAYHTNMADFSNWAITLSGSWDDTWVWGGAGQTSGGPEGAESLTLTADRHYDAGTPFAVYCAIWPGESTTWVDSIVYTPTPEPATLLLLGLGGLMLRKRGI